MGFKNELEVIFDYLISIACVILLFLELCHPGHWSLYVLRGVGAFYCVWYLYIGFLCPIKRDWILVKGKFLRKVINFVLLVPFVLVGLLRIMDDVLGHKFDISPKDIVYEENLYEFANSEKDTLRIVSSHRTIDAAIADKDSIWSSETFICIDNNLPDSISRAQEDPSLFWTVYYHFIDPGNQHMTTSKVGRIVSIIIAVLGFVLLNGLLISTLISWFDRRRDQWINGEIRYGWLPVLFKKVAVVIGANESTPTIIKRLLSGCGEKPIDYVILLTNEDVETVREQISSYLNCYEEKRVIIYNGQLDSIEEIEELQIKRATEIYVLGENSNDDVSHSYHDTQNMRCVHNIASYLTDKCVERKIVCRVLFEYQTTYSVFQFSDLPDNIRQHLVFIPFNAYENWAQRVFVKGEYTEPVKKIMPALRKMDLQPTLVNRVLHPVINCVQSIMPKNNEEERTVVYSPLDGRGISSDSKDHVHVVIVGMSKMGIAMAIQAAQVAHYPNFSTGIKDDKGNVLRNPSPIRTRITFIDKSADDEMNFFMGRYQNLFALSRYRYIDASGNDCDLQTTWNDPMEDVNCKYKKHGSNFIDIEWEFIKGSVEAPSIMAYLRDAALQADNVKSDSGKSLLTIAICHPLSHEAIAAALYMPSEVYDFAQQILVYQREASDIVYNLSVEDNIYKKHKRYSKLRPFGMQHADFTMDKDNYYRAQLCNYVYTLMFDSRIEKGLIPELLCSIQIADKNEESMKQIREAWKKLSIFNKWSNKYLANSFETKLRSVKADFKNISLHYDVLCSLIESNKNDMAECEHNRWNVQQLLMGFRAYRDDELALFVELGNYAASSNEAQTAFQNFKDKMKNSAEKVHLNICSISLLQKLDKKAKGYDEIFNSAIPAILKCVEAYKKEISNNA